MVVSEREIAACIRAGARTLDDVTEACEAGGGCGSCRGGIEVMLDEHRRGALKPGASEASAVLAQLGLFRETPDR
jgi:bacterioferritin-associated ferredoxin